MMEGCFFDFAYIRDELASMAITVAIGEAHGTEHFLHIGGRSKKEEDGVNGEDEEPKDTKVSETNNLRSLDFTKMVKAIQ